MAIFKKSSVAPIVRTVISQGIKDESIDSSNFYTADKLKGLEPGEETNLPVDNSGFRKVLEKLFRSRLDYQTRIRNSYDELDQVFNDGAIEAITTAIDLLEKELGINRYGYFAQELDGDTKPRLR